MTDEPNVAEIVAKLTEGERDSLTGSGLLVDGRVLVPAYSVPDMLTAPYSVHRSALNRAGLAVRQHLLEQNP